jgi:hypothetical protein
MFTNVSTILNQYLKEKKTVWSLAWLENRLFGEAEIGVYAQDSNGQSEQS